MPHPHLARIIGRDGAQVYAWVVLPAVKHTHHIMSVVSQGAAAAVPLHFVGGDFGRVAGPIENVGVLYGAARVRVGHACFGRRKIHHLVVGVFRHYQIVRLRVRQGLCVAKHDTPRVPIVRVEGYWVGFGVAPQYLMQAQLSVSVELENSTAARCTGAKRHARMAVAVLHIYRRRGAEACFLLSFNEIESVIAGLCGSVCQPAAACHSIQKFSQSIQRV